MEAYLTQIGETGVAKRTPLFAEHNSLKQQISWMKGPQQWVISARAKINDFECRHETNSKPSTATFLMNLKFPQVESFI